MEILTASDQARLTEAGRFATKGRSSQPRPKSPETALTFPIPESEVPTKQL